MSTEVESKKRQVEQQQRAPARESGEDDGTGSLDFNEAGMPTYGTSSALNDLVGAWEVTQAGPKPTRADVEQLHSEHPNADWQTATDRVWTVAEREGVRNVTALYRALIERQGET